MVKLWKMSGDLWKLKVIYGKYIGNIMYLYCCLYVLLYGKGGSTGIGYVYMLPVMFFLCVCSMCLPCLCGEGFVRMRQFGAK